MLKRQVQNIPSIRTQASLTVTLKCDTRYSQVRGYIACFLPVFLLVSLLVPSPSQVSLSLTVQSLTFQIPGKQQDPDAIPCFFGCTIELKNHTDLDTKTLHLWL